MYIILVIQFLLHKIKHKNRNINSKGDRDEIISEYRINLRYRINYNL